MMPTGDGKVEIPWGLNIDGNDDVWVGNFGPLASSVVLLAGDNTAGHPADTKTGDLIHEFRSGSIQMLTDMSIDPAGNVWAANNWCDPLPAVKGMIATAGLLTFAWSTGILMTLAQEFQDRHVQLFKQQHGPDGKPKSPQEKHPRQDR